MALFHSNKGNCSPERETINIPIGRISFPICTCVHLCSCDFKKLTCALYFFLTCGKNLRKQRISNTFTILSCATLSVLFCFICLSFFSLLGFQLVVLIKNTQISWARICLSQSFRSCGLACYVRSSLVSFCLSHCFTV